MSKKIFNLIFLIFIIKEVMSEEEANISSTLNNPYFDAHTPEHVTLFFEEEIQRIKGMYMNNVSTPSMFDRNIELFLPKYDFQRPEKFKKESYSKLYRLLSDTNKRQDAPKDVFIYPEDIIEENEFLYKKDLLEKIIKKEVNMEDVNYSSDYEIFAFPDKKRFENDPPKFVNVEDPNMKIKNFSEISNFLQFEQKELIVNDKPICIPTMKLLTVKNTMTENMILRSIKSDLYQVTMFYFRPGTQNSNQSYNQKNVYPKTILPGENMIFQLIILPDIVGKFKGNIYLEFNNNKVVVFPLIINSVENIYRVNPIYSYNWLGSKLLQIPITIYNPHSKTLIVKEVINSFSSINLVWPNGQSVSSNHTSISSQMLEIPPKSSKNLMMINFYKEVPGIEYGLLQMKTDKDTLIIPVLIRVEIQAVKIFPNYYNFGLIDLNKNIKRLIPITLHNVGKNPLQIKALYATYEENLIEFIPNLGSFSCPSMNNYNNTISNTNNNFNNFFNPNQYNANLCIMNPMESQLIFGYLMLDPSNYTPELNDQNLNKKIKGSFILQTNFTENPFIELYYEYYLDKDTFINTSESSQFDLFYEIGPNAKNSYKYEISTKLKPPFTFNLANPYLNQLEEAGFDVKKVKRTNSIKAEDVVYVIPESNQITARYTELNDTLKFTINLDNPNNFVNRKNYFFAVKTNLNLFTLIPIKFYDRSVDLHYCDSFPTYRECQNENFSIFKSVNFKNTVINVDFGIISTSETGKKYFSILNDNNQNISIFDIDTTKINLLLGLESIEDIQTNEKISHASKFQMWENGGLQRRLKNKFVNGERENIPINLISNTYVTFSINVNSNQEGDLNGSLNLYFNNANNNKIKLTINVTAKFFKGSFNISPSVIRFEPAFPGFYQSKLVSSKSSYNIPINIHSVKSQDQRIIPVLLTNNIISNNRTEILKVIFDPSRVSLEENFMKGEMFFNTSRILTYKELYLWKEKQKLWEFLGSKGRTEINTQVKIKTNIQSETVNVRAFLTKPSLVKKDVIDFGLVQIGESQSKYIEVYNPSDEPMVIQVLLASEEFSDIHNNNMFNKNRKFRFTSENELTMMECHFFNMTQFDSISSNFTYNSISQKNQKRKKKTKSDDDLGIDTKDSIIIDEDSIQNSITQRSINKTDLIKKLFLFANQNIKQNFIGAERLICNTNYMKKNEIILNNYKELTEKIFSSEFNKEINIVKKMTECTPPQPSRKEGKETNFGLFERIAQLMKVFFKTEIMNKKKKSKETKNQEFFLPKILSQQVYNIKPHQKLNIGPIIFYPSQLTNNSATLFIKNNLTILYPIKLRGNGGSGVLNFSILEKDYNNSLPYQFIETPIDNHLVIDVDSNSYDGFNYDNFKSDVIIKTLKLKNTGNLPVKINNVSIENSGCEAYGIKLHKCEGIYLKPDESFKMQITVKPDFNFYFIEKDIIFETGQNTINLKVTITISNELLNHKNRLFNFDYLKDYGYISIFVVLFIVSVIMYILSIEYFEITHSKQMHSELLFISSKEIIENNPTLKFENLFIKSYRKFNQGFYDDFVYKQFDKPGTGVNEMDTVVDKRKLSNKISRDRRSEDVKEKEIIQEEQNLNDKVDMENKLDENKLGIGIQNLNQNVKDIQSVIKNKKENISKLKKDTKKVTTKKPIGIGLKPNEKREDLEVNLNLKKTPAEYINPPNKFDNVIVGNTPYVKYPSGGATTTNTNTIPNTNINTNTNAANYFGTKDDYFQAAINPNQPTNNNPALSNPNLANQNYNYYEVDNSIYNTTQGYWPKTYNNTYSNYNVNQNQPKPQLGYNTQSRYATNYYNQPGLYNTPYNVKSAGTSNPNLIPVNEKTNSMINLENNLNPQINIDQPSVNNSIDNTNKLILENENKNEILSAHSNFNYSTILKEEILSDYQNKKELDLEKEKSINNETPSLSNLREQFLAFAPDVFTKKIESSEENVDEVEHFTNEEKPKTVENVNENLSQQFISFNQIPDQSFKSNFDFTNIFAKPEEPKEIVSEMEDNKNFPDEDASSHNYQSEKEKFIDSGTEDLKFNFNSIFNQNNMKFTMDYDNDYTDNDDKDTKDGNKPYFDKNLFFSFDSAFINNKPNLFTTDPFANTNNKKSLLSELRDEENIMKEDAKEHERLNRLDEVAENEDEDDEEDPAWGDDNVTDIKKEGFFDETGTYKLKQMDFNFNLNYDFKLKK